MGIRDLVVAAFCQQSVSTDFIMKCKELGLNVTEVFDSSTGTNTVLFTRPEHMMPVVSFTLMAGGLFRLGDNICLPPSIVQELPRRMDDEEEALLALEYISTELREWEAV